MEEVHQVWEGRALGGPLDGQEVYCQSPKGMVVLSESSPEVWVYDRDASDGSFVGRLMGTRDPQKLAQAQEDGGRAVRMVE